MNKWIIIFSLTIFAVLLVSGCVEQPPQPPPGSQTCTDLNGSICSEMSTETCLGTWLGATDSDRCCSEQCTPQPVCDMGPTGKPFNCRCYPNENKDKVAIIVNKSGIYDTPEIASIASAYFDAVESDLGIENAGLQKFNGTTIEELEGFVDNLYFSEDVAYIILVGNDLPVFADHHALYEKLEYVNRTWELEACFDLAVSYIPAPIAYSDTEKVEFTKKVLQNFVDFHNNPQSLFSQYQNKALRVLDESLEPIAENKPNYTFELVEVYNKEHDQVQTYFKEKHILLILDVHGSTLSVGMGLTPDDPKFGGLYTTEYGYRDFVEKNGLPALFVDSGACYSTVLFHAYESCSWPSDAPENLTCHYEYENYCCWPQAFLDSGVLAYYSASGGGEEIENIENALATEKTIGHAIRKVLHSQNFIFGDILSYFP